MTPCVLEETPLFINQHLFVSPRSILRLYRLYMLLTSLGATAA